MDYAAEGTIILSSSKQTMTIVILSLDCYTKTCIDCVINSYFLYTLYKLRFDNFVLNEDDDDNGGGRRQVDSLQVAIATFSSF